MKFKLRNYIHVCYILILKSFKYASDVLVEISQINQIPRNRKQDVFPPHCEFRSQCMCNIHLCVLNTEAGAMMQDL